MILAKNYETASKFVKVMTKIPWPLFFRTRCRYVDYMLLMTYNYHGNWNEFTGHHSAMFPRSDEVASEREWNQVYSTTQSNEL